MGVVLVLSSCQLNDLHFSEACSPLLLSLGHRVVQDEQKEIPSFLDGVNEITFHPRLFLHASFVVFVSPR